MYDVIIVGSGPAGLTAALHLCRAKLSTLVLEKTVMGGELMSRDLIENYPGFPNGIMGPELGANMVEQVINLGAEIRLADVMTIRVEGDTKVVNTTEGDFRSTAVIIAGGSLPRKLGVPGEEEFGNRGVFYCTGCDAPAFTSKVVFIAGGGDCGLTEALLLARMASKVIVVEIMPQLGACKSLQERALANSVIEIRCGFKIEAIRGREKVEVVDLLDIETGQSTAQRADGVLIRVGLLPNTHYLKGVVPLDVAGQIIVDECMKTQVPGIFAAGNIRQNSPCQLSTAIGDGATAALSLEREFFARR